MYVAISVATRLLVLRADIVNGDEASYVVGAWELLRGHLPYTVFADNKPPLIYLYYALAQFLGHGTFGVRLLTMVVTVPLTALGISSFFRHETRGLVGALAFLVYSATYIANDMLAVNCELVMLLPLAWALVAVRDGAAATRPSAVLVAGVLVGVATLVKYQAVFWLPALCLQPLLVMWRGRRREGAVAIAVLAVGVLLPVLATVSLFAVLGGLEGFMYWNVWHNVGYVLSPITAGEAVRRGAERFGPWFLTTALLWLGVIRSRRLTTAYERSVVLATIALSLLATTVGLRFFPHYLVQLYVPLAIASAPWLTALAQAADRRPMRLAVTASVGLFVAFTLWNAHLLASDTFDNARSRKLSEWLRADPCYGQGALFVWGSSPRLYYHAGLPIASRFFFPEFPLVRYTAGVRTATAEHRRVRARDRRGQSWRWLMADLHRSRPTYIVDTAPAHISMWEYFPLRDHPLLDRFVQREYEPIGVVDEMQIYRRRYCRGELVASDQF